MVQKPGEIRRIEKIPSRTNYVEVARCRSPNRNIGPDGNSRESRRAAREEYVARADRILSQIRSVWNRFDHSGAEAPIVVKVSKLEYSPFFRPQLLISCFF